MVAFRHSVRLGFVVIGWLCVQTLPVLAQYSEQLEVSIANVDVVVTDRKGNPILGLTADDFEIYESGRLMPITNFSAYEGAPGKKDAAIRAETPSKPQPRLIVLFIDINDIEPHRRQQFFTGIRKFLRSSLREGDLVTVLSWNRRIQTLLEPTDDPGRIKVALDGLSEPYGNWEMKIARELAAMQVEMVEREAEALGSLASEADPEAEREFQQWLIDEQRCQATKRKTKELRNLLASFSRVDMKKVLVFASDDLSLNPTGDCLTSREIDALADTANAYGMAIHALHPSGARDNVIRPDFGGLPQYNAPAPASSAYSRAWDESGGLMVLAERTGGHIGVGAAQSSKLLEQIAEQLDSYYSLGYRMPQGREDRPRSIKVVTKNPKHRVRVRQSVVKISEAGRLRDLVTTNLYLPQPSQAQRPAFEAVTGKITRDGRFLVVGVSLTIRAKDLVVLPVADGGQRGSFSVFVAAGREIGDASDVIELTQEFDAPAQSGDDPVIEYSFDARIRPDTRRLSIVVRDNQTGEVASKVVSIKPNGAASTE